MIAELVAALETSPLGMMARESAWVYPLANIVHLLGLILLVGGIGLLDLRLAGCFRTLPLDPLCRALTPFAILGLLLLAGSGTLLFVADAGALVRSPRFQAKLLLIAIALANVLVFRLLWRGETTPHLLLRVVALLSLLLWLTVAALGRLIAYA